MNPTAKWGNNICYLVTNSDKNVVYKCHGDTLFTYTCPVEVWQTGIIPWNIG